MAQLLVVQEKQIIAQHNVSGQQFLPQQEGTTFVIDQAGQNLPQIHHNGEQVWVVLGEEEGLLLDAQNSADLFLQTPTQNYQLLSGQWVPVTGQPWAGATVLAETVIAPVSESASISGLTAFGLGALGLAGAGLAGSGGGSNNDTPPPAPPVNPNPPVNPPPVNPPANHTGSISISGEAKVGSTLTASISDADGVPTNIAYQWYADGQPITGANAATYTLTAAQTGKTITVQAAYVDNASHNEAPLSGSTAAVVANTQPPVNPPPVNPPANHTGSVSISGEAKVGSTLTAKVSDADGVPANIKYQWYADGQPISGANAATYTLTAAQTGKAVTVQATYTDNANHSETPLSGATAAVVGNAQPPVQPPANQPASISISGDIVVGKTLTANVKDGNGLPSGSLKYQWYADGKAISGATGKNYTLANADAGKQISVQAEFKDNAGYSEQPASAATAKIKVGVYVPAPTTDFVADVTNAAYGAKGDGKTDNTAAIQKAINAAAAAGGGIVDIPAGVYMVDAVNNRLHLKSNVILRLDDDAVLKAFPTDKSSYDIIRLRNVDNAHIIGGTLEGDRADHLGIGGEGGHGIRLMAATNAVIEGVTARGMWGDGIYLGKDATFPTQNENIMIHNVTLDNNLRQGLTITHAKGVKVLDSEFTNNNGTEPKSGFCIEPNAGQNVSNVEVRGNLFSGNNIGFLVANNKEGTRVTNVVFEDNVLRDNPRDAIIMRGLEDSKVANNLIYQDPDAYHTTSGGIRLYDGENKADNPNPRNTNNVEISNNTLYGGFIIPTTKGSNAIHDNLFKSAVYIRGEAKAGETLTAALYDADGFDAAKVKYQWYADGKAIDGATGKTYTLATTDAGKQITVQAVFTDKANQAETATGSIGGQPGVSAKESGALLDIARHFYTPATIQKFIDDIADAGGTFLHLHASNTENYALESTLLGQTAANATLRSDGVYVNPANGKPFLSNEQIKTIIQHAQSKGIEVIPEVGAPAHMKGIYDLLAAKQGSSYANSLFDISRDADYPELYFNLDAGKAFIKSLYSEVAANFSGSGTYFHIGGDEFSIAAGDYGQYVSYANQIAEFLAENGLKTRMWNDGVLKTKLADLSKAIEITYWSLDGNRPDDMQTEWNITHRASVKELLDHGFEVLNYNDAYLYHNPSEFDIPSENIEKSSDTSLFSRNDGQKILSEWHLGIWDEQHTDNAVDPARMKGAALSIWGEHAGNMDGETIRLFTGSRLDALIQKTNAAADPTGQQAAQLKALKKTDFASLSQDFYLDFSHIDNGKQVDLSGGGKDTLKLLHEEVLASRGSLEITISGGLQSGAAESQRDAVELDSSKWKKTGSDANYEHYSYQETRLLIENDVIIQLV